MTKVLALDLATLTGIAFDGPGEGNRVRPIALSLRLRPRRSRDDGPDLDFGTPGAALWRWLTEHCSINRPDVIAFEAPVVRFNQGSHPTTRMEAVRLLIGLAFLVETFARSFEPDHPIRCFETTNNEVKAHWAGNGRAEKSDMVRMCRQMRVDVPDDNAADAVGLWSLAKTSLGEPIDWDTTHGLFRAQRASAMPIGGPQR